MRIRTFLFGALTGAAIAYLYDPVAGRSRRSRLRDQGLSKARTGVRDLTKKGRYASNVAQGALAQMASTPGPNHAVPDDRTIAERVRAEVLGAADVPKDRIVLEVIDGTAVLRGELDSMEDIEAVERRVGAVEGVEAVENLMHLPGRPAPNKAEAIDASEAAERGDRTRRPA